MSSAGVGNAGTLLRSAALLAGAGTGDRFAALPALRAALSALFPVDYLEVVYRDPRRGAFERVSVRSADEAPSRASVASHELLAEAHAAAVGPMRVAGLASLGLAAGAAPEGALARAPLARGDGAFGWVACARAGGAPYDDAQLALLGDVAALVGDALAGAQQTAALAAQGRIAEVLASGGDIAESCGRIAEIFREVLSFDRFSLLGPVRANGQSEVLCALGEALGPFDDGALVECGDVPAHGCLLVYDAAGRVVEGELCAACPAESGGAMRALVLVPLDFEGARQGLLALASLDAGAYTASDLQRVRGTAALLAAHVALQESVRKLEASEAEYKSLYHQIAATHTKLLQAEKLASVGQLAAGVAHEINNPAAVVMSNLSHLSSVLPDTRKFLARYREALRTADAAAAERLAADERAFDLATLEAEIDESVSESLNAMRRIRDIVRNLMRFARGPSAQVEEAQLRDLSERAISIAQNEIRHRAKLQRDYQTVPSVRVEGSAFVQVLVNLLLNAAQAIPDGAAESHTIAVRIAEERGYAVIEVRDDGVGIPKDTLSRVFDPFFTTKPVGQGTGLGLSIAHDLVGKNGGEITLESEVGVGTTARIRLPLRGVASEGAAALTGASGGKRSLMIIDDEPAVLRSAARILRQEYAITTVASGEEALRLLEGGARPDLILCDLLMPSMTGIDVHERIAERFPALEPRILFMTGGAFTPNAVQFAERMGRRIIDKPLDGRELRDRVARHVASITK